MKLSGNKRNGRYAVGSNRRQVSSAVNSQKEHNRVNGTTRKKRKSRHAGKIVISFLVVIIALGATIYSVYKVGVRPPDMKPKDPINNPPSGVSPTVGMEIPDAVSSGRKGTQYTFVLLGFDDGNGNSDTIMVVNFDVDNYKLNIVSIPRDTLVNVKWSTKKANTFYANSGIEGVVSGLSDVLGFHVDFYVQVNLKAFAALVDAIDGVYYDVPKNMRYSDPSQDLEINLEAGPQLLDGKKALQLVRCRSVYSNADIGRIETQQGFLKAAAEQILANQNKLDITELASIFIKNVKTDLDLGEIIWLGKEFYKMDSANISFDTIPANYYDTVNKISYCTINVNDWLKMLNEKIYPYDEEIKAEDLSILTRDANGKLYVTNGVWAGSKSWGSGGGSSGSAASPSPKPSQSPSPSPGSSPSPSPSDISPSSGVGDGDTSPDVSPDEPDLDTSPSPSPTPSPTPNPTPSPSPSPSPTPSPSPSPSDDVPLNPGNP